MRRHYSCDVTLMQHLTTRANRRSLLAIFCYKHPEKTAVKIKVVSIFTIAYQLDDRSAFPVACHVMLYLHSVITNYLV